MFAPGPAMIATSRFHVGAFQYAWSPRASLSSLRPFSALESARGESFRSRSASSRSSSAPRPAGRSVASSARFTRSIGPASPGASSAACANRRSASYGIGRCIPGIDTNPPSGIAPMPYSIPLRLHLTSAGGNPT
jgi:hypothetical protein